MKTEEYKIPVAAKLRPGQAKKLADRCTFRGISQSSFIRQAILDKLESPAIPNIAGQNVIEYDPKTNTFLWKIKTDEGNEKIIVENISKDFLENLLKEVKSRLKDMEELINKKNKNSVAIPRRLLE